jgi:hypothetical protein
MVRLVQLQPIDAIPTQGPTATFGETVGAMFEREQTVGEVGSQSRFLNDVYEPFIGYFNSTVRPMAPDLFSFGIENSARAENRSPISLETFRAIEDQGFHPDEETLGRFVQELEAAGLEVPPEIAPAALMARREEMEAALLGEVEQMDEVLARSRGVSGIFGQLVGGFGAGFDNVESVLTMPIGAASRAGILATALIEGGVNAAAEAATTPGRNEFLRELGLPEESILENAAFGFAVGGALGGGIRSITRLGEFLSDRRETLVELAEASGDPELQALAQAVRRDIEDEQAAVAERDPDELREHTQRAEVAAQAAQDGGLPEMPDRPVFATPRASILNGEIEEVDPRELLVQPDVFQFKSEIVADGGVTPKLLNVTEWRPERAGITLIYEYADGSRAVADGHQRTALARRLMDQTGQEIRLAARVFRETDGFTPEDVRVLAALKNISEAADGMTAAMAKDAARVLRVRPEAITELPAGPGIVRAQSLARLSDEAFDMFINQAVPERFAELVGRMVDDPRMHGAMMQLLRRTGPDSTAQAESILSQALQAPVTREVTADLFGEQEIVESLYLERARVLERAMKIMRDDRSVFRTLDERADRIQGTGQNRLDTATNKETRQQVERALAAVAKLAHRAGPISEALNDGARSYRENGRLKDAAERVAAAVRQEVERNGLTGAGDGAPRRGAEPSRSGAKAPDPLEGFSDPVNGEAVAAQIAATRIQPAAAPRIDRLPDMDPAEAAEVAEGLKTAQGFRDMDDLMERGARNHVELTREIEVAAQRAGVTARAAPLKSRERTEQKVRDKYRGNLNRVTDVARGGVDAATPEAAEAFVETLARRYRVLDEGWNLVAGGYFDRKLTVVFDDGQLGEVQLWVPGMFEVKEARGHKLYEVFRDASRPDAERAQALADMEALYAGVMDKLPERWRSIFAQDTPGMDAPSRATTETKTSSDTSGEPSSARTSEGATSPQEPSSGSRSSMEPGSGSTAGMERSTRKNRMGDTSTLDVSGAGPVIKTERTSAGEQSLFDGIEPITERTRLDQRMSAPLGRGGRQDDTQIGGLFDPNDPSRFDLFDAVPVGRGFDDEGNEIAVVKSRADLAAELDADDEAVAVLDLCVR